jgi:hypothetical protein
MLLSILIPYGRRQGGASFPFYPKNIYPINIAAMMPARSAIRPQVTA